MPLLVLQSVQLGRNLLNNGTEVRYFWKIAEKLVFSGRLFLYFTI
jgi:hypothetical protein